MAFKRTKQQSLNSRVYTILWGTSKLSDAHRSFLKSLKISDKEIKDAHFFTLPDLQSDEEFWDWICPEQITDEQLLSVPGFCGEPGNIHLNFVGCLAVPLSTTNREYKTIHGIQVFRLQPNGQIDVQVLKSTKTNRFKAPIGCITDITWPNSLKSKNIWITDNKIHAIRIAKVYGTPVITLIGFNQRAFKDVLHCLWQMRRRSHHRFESIVFDFDVRISWILYNFKVFRNQVTRVSTSQEIFYDTQIAQFDPLYGFNVMEVLNNRKKSKIYFVRAKVVLENLETFQNFLTRKHLRYATLENKIMVYREAFSREH